jgi:hypothetical protein
MRTWSVSTHPSQDGWNDWPSFFVPLGIGLQFSQMDSGTARNLIENPPPRT